MDWTEAALEVADTMGMKDETVIPTWPKGVGDIFPALTVGAVRKLVARLEAAERAMDILQRVRHATSHLQDHEITGTLLAASLPTGSIVVELITALAAWEAAK